MKNVLVRMAAVAALFAAFGLALVPGAGAQGVTELTVHHRLCGDNYKGGNEFDECHDVLVGTALEFTIDGPVTATEITDANGNVIFTPIPAGTYHLFGGVPGEFSDQTIYCSDQNTGLAVSVTGGAIGVNVDVPEGASVVCDVYEFPIDMRGEPTPAPTQAPAKPTAVPPMPTPTGGRGVTNLPNTGAGDGNGTFPTTLLLIPALAALGFGLVARKRVVR